MPQNKVSALNHRLWSMVWPLIISNITVPLLGLVDTAVLGHLDTPLYLAAVALGGNLFSLVFWSFGFLRMGTTGLAAQAWGRKSPPELRDVFLRTLLISALIGLIILVTRELWLTIGLQLMQAKDELLTESLAYGNIRCLSAPAVLIQYSVIGWLIGTQRTKAALWIAVTTNLINIGLDLLFVVGLGWATRGVATATIIAEYYAVVLGLFFVWPNLEKPLHRLKSALFWNRLDFVRVFRLNGNLLLRTVLLLFVFAFFTAQGAALGTEILAANAVLLTFLFLISSALDGFANGAEALCGESLGQKNLAEFQRITRTCGVWSLVSAGALTLLFMLFGNSIINLLTNIPSTASLAQEYLVWIILMPIVGIWSYLFDGIFIGATKSKAMRDTLVISALIIFLPSWFLTREWGNDGLWFSLLLFLAARGVVQAWLYRNFTIAGKWI